MISPGGSVWIPSWGSRGIDGHAGATADSVAEWTQVIGMARSRHDAIQESSALRGLAITWINAGKAWIIAATLTAQGESSTRGTSLHWRKTSGPAL